MGRPVIDLTGQRFSRLVVLERAGSYGHKQPTWLCRCDCGQTSIARGGKLKEGKKTSCGCVHGNIRHGHNRAGRRTSEYHTWASMYSRCQCPSHLGYKNYGGRGIKVEFTSFEEFLAYIGPKPSPKHSIDRIDNNGHYAPGNVRWADWKTQANNKRQRKTKELNYANISRGI